MAKEIGSMSELQKLFDQQCKQLCEFAANEFYEALNYFLNQYYTEWTPRSYQRSYDLLHSAFKTEAKSIKNGYEIIVGIDYESLSNYEEATGLQVITWANQALHGGYDAGTDTRVWDDSVDSAINSGQLLADCIMFLKGYGFTITT